MDNNVHVSGNDVDYIRRQDALDLVTTDKPQLLDGDALYMAIEDLPSAGLGVAEKIYRYKCYITDSEGLRHEVIHIDDIRRVTGWTI